MLRVTTLCLGAYGENCYILEGRPGDGLLIIDPGDDLEAIERAIGQTGEKPVALLLTHGHFDHTLAAAPLRDRYGAPVYIHPLDRHMLADPTAAVMDEGAARLPFVPIEPDATYPPQDRFELTIGAWKVTGLHTPGHTPGGVSLLLTDDRALFTGDTLFSYGYGRYDFPGGDVRALMKSIRGLLTLDGDLTVYSGHGEKDTMARIAARWGVAGA